jgi:D-glycero-D-manno-heptose 1,7-bisphosphate phosphatase
LCVIVVTNQRCVAKGLLTEVALRDLHQRMSHEVAKAGATIDAIYYCPHELEPPCKCRKPAPTMLLEAARSRDLDLSSSWVIGDSDADIQAGKSAGCRTVLLASSIITTQKLDNEYTKPVDADITAASLLEAVAEILEIGNL